MLPVFCSISPLGVTPRSGRSDPVRSVSDEEIEEDIKGDLSEAEDLLKSDHSGVSTGHSLHHFVLALSFPIMKSSVT